MGYKRQGRLVQPKVGALIDWSHPLARDLVMWISPLQGNGYRLEDLTQNGSLCTMPNSTAVTVGPTKVNGWTGVNWPPLGSGTAVDLVLPTNTISRCKSSSSRNWSMGVFWRFPGSNQGYPLLQRGDFGANTTRLLKSSDGGDLRFTYGNTFQFITGAGFFGSDYPHFSVGVHRVDNSVTLYDNGDVSGTGTDAQTWDASPYVYFVGENNGGLGCFGESFIFAHWNRDLSFDEVRWLNAEPWVVLKQYASVAYFFTIVSGALNITPSDNLNFLADGLSLVGGDPDFKVQLGDSLQQSDSARIVNGLLQTFSDSVNNWADVVSSLSGIPIAVFDSNQFNWADAIALQYLAPLTVSKSDTLVLSDAVSLVLGNVVISITAADTMNLMADAVRIFNRLLIEVGDNFVMSDALRMRFTHLLRAADIINQLADSPRLNMSARPAFADDMNNLSDAVSVALSALVTRSAADTLAMSDSVSVQLDTPYNPATDILRIRRYLNDTE